LRRTLVLAIGNDLRGDDRLGFDAIRMLKDAVGRASGPASHLDFQEAYTGGLDLLEAMEGYDRVLLLDALATGTCAPGTVVEFCERDLPRAGSASPHYVTLPEVTDLAASLGIRFPGEIRILGLEAEQAYEFRAGLSPAISRALPQLVARARAILDEWT
jgi:hydrogenase maturation protease